jgi:hypothetical protein
MPCGVQLDGCIVNSTFIVLRKTSSSRINLPLQDNASFCLNDKLAKSGSPDDTPVRGEPPPAPEVFWVRGGEAISGVGSESQMEVVSYRPVAMAAARLADAACFKEVLA